jgi:hypothetical protein
MAIALTAYIRRWATTRTMGVVNSCTQLNAFVDVIGTWHCISN